MKNDCSMTENYLKEKARMTKDCQIACMNCPLRKTGHEEDFYSTILCKGNIKEYIEEVIAIVQQWSDEHPQKTWLDLLKDRFPDMKINIKSLIERYTPYALFGEKAESRIWEDFVDIIERDI